MQNLPQSYWNSYRNMFLSLCRLSQKVDNTISLLLFSSLALNLMFLLIQAYNTLLPKPSISDMIYFWYSMVFLIGRISGVICAAASVQTESTRTVKIVEHAITPENFCLELFLFKNCHEFATITGWNMFTVDKKVMLTVSLTIFKERIIIFLNLNDAFSLC